MSLLYSQKGPPRHTGEAGFSAVSLFFLILAAMIVASFSGTFKPMLSETTDKSAYSPTGSKDANGSGLLITDLNFTTPSPANSSTPTLTPGPTTKKCISDSGRQVDPNECECPIMTFLCAGGKAIGMNGKPNPFPYNDKFCKAPLSDGLDGYYCVGKPVIYLYPKFPMLVTVNVMTAGEVFMSDPQIEKGNYWRDVIAHPNGILIYKGNAYRELFYEAAITSLNPPSKGIIIKNSDIEGDLTDFIKRLGLTRKNEQQEFLEWWLPQLREYNSPYWFVSILEQDEKQRIDRVEISPKPDTFIEFIVYFKPLQEFANIKKLILPPTPRRIGFTAVEWGGVIDSKY